MRVRLLTLRTYTFTQVRTGDIYMKIVKKILIFVLRLALAILGSVIRDLNAGRIGSSKFGKHPVRRRRW